MGGVKRRIIKNLSVSLFLFSFLANAQQILVPPYIQPGNTPNLNKEQKVLIWQTDSIPGKYAVEYTLNIPGQKTSTAKTSFVKLNLKNKTTFLYRANLTGLKFDSEYSYKVSLSGESIADGSFNTRTKNSQTKFAVYGDCGAGTPQQAKIAWQVFQQKPQFLTMRQVKRIR
jgi:acid phosphatase type 7